MSRSYKKTPRSGDQKDKFFKTYANRKFRRDKFNNLQHNSYKKNFCHYDICDYETVGETFEEWWKHCVSVWHNWGCRYEPYPSREEEYRRWYKWFKAK